MLLRTHPSLALAALAALDLAVLPAVALARALYTAHPRMGKKQRYYVVDAAPEFAGLR